MHMHMRMRICASCWKYPKAVPVLFTYCHVFERDLSGSPVAVSVAVWRVLAPVVRLAGGLNCACTCSLLLSVIVCSLAFNLVEHSERSGQRVLSFIY